MLCPPVRIANSGAPSTGQGPQENRRFARLRRSGLLAVWLFAAAPLAQSAPPTPVDVWKAPSCGCCADWIKIMEASGFQIKTHEMGNSAIRKGLRMADKYGSCHTALVQGYALEGHVPVREVKRLLRERPKAVGLAVPGMPIGSAGMDGPAYGGRRVAYDVLLVQRDGSSAVFQNYR